MFYPDRTYGTTFKQALDDGMDASIVETASAWVDENKLDVKRSDAIELLELIET